MVLFEVLARVRRSTSNLLDILALLALALAVSGEVIGFEYSHRKEDLYEQREQMLTEAFHERLEDANNRLHDTENLAKNAQNAVKELKEEEAGRILTLKQRSVLLDLLKAGAPQELYFVCAPDPESQAYFNQLFVLLREAGWNFEVHPYNWGSPQTYPPGLEIMVQDTKHAPQGATVLQTAFKKAGIDANGVNFFMLPAGKFALYVGPKAASSGNSP